MNWQYKLLASSIDLYVRIFKGNMYSVNIVYLGGGDMGKNLGEIIYYTKRQVNSPVKSWWNLRKKYLSNRIVVFTFIK